MNTYESAKEQVKRAADIVELIGQFVQLKKAGRNYVGLCPFHAEKAPSFTVSAEKQIFHCFGCKKGGDVFSFWMAYHNATFPETLKDLADRYQVALPEGPYAAKDKEKAALREILFTINERAALYFQKTLRDPAKGQSARAYLDRRSLPEELIAEFALGYAADEWDGLTRFLERHGVDLRMAVRAGLVIPKKSGGYYDRFRGRVMFPIFNMRQQVIGFGGRVLDDSLPKYLNTPETPIFHKGEMPYGLHVSFRAIRERHRAVVVEGYMDFLALRQHGLPEVVATLGTALTPEHVRRLKGYADTVVMVFDSDEAGRSAVLNSAPLFSNEGVSAKAVILPDGHDPDSFVNLRGLESFVSLLDRAPSLLDFYVEQKLSEKKDDVEQKVTILKDMLPVLSALHEPAQRALYARRLSERLGLQESVIWAELKNYGRGAAEATIERNVKERLTAPPVARKFDELHLLNLLVHYPQAIPRLMTTECRLLMSDAVVLEIVDSLFRKYGEDGQVSMEEVEKCLSSEAAREQLREIVMEPPHYSEEEVSLAVAEVEQKVHQKKISAYVRKARGDANALNQILELKRLKDKDQQVGS